MASQHKPIMKKTLQQKLAEKKFRRPNVILYKTLYKLVVKHMLEPKYNVHYTREVDINDCKGPCFLVYNHQSRIDYVWLMGATYPKRLNFLVGYNEFFRSHLAFILRIANVIPKKNFTLDVPAMKGIASIIRQGGCVCFSPEGMSSISGHNQPAVSGTGNFLKHYGIPVYQVEMAGAYLTNTKYCLDERKGRIDVNLKLLFSPEYLSNAEPEEIEEKLNDALYHDDFEWNAKKQIHFDMKGRPTHDLHYLLYRCPNCGHELCMESDDAHIHCRDCGFSATLDDTYKLHPAEGYSCPESISRWFDEERGHTYQQIKEDPERIYEFKCKIGRLPPFHYVKNMKTSEPAGEGVAIINKHGFTYEGTLMGEPVTMFLTYNEMPTFGMPVDTSYLAFYHNGDYYDLFPENGASIKMLHLLEEFGRLATGKWPLPKAERWIYSK